MAIANLHFLGQAQVHCCCSVLMAQSAWEAPGLSNIMKIAFTYNLSNVHV